MIDGISNSCYLHSSDNAFKLYILELFLPQYYYIAAVGSGVGKMVGSEVGDTE